MKEGTIVLSAGYHDIKLRFLDRDNFSHIYLFWSPPGKGLEKIPSAYLFPPRGEYPQPPEGLPDIPNIERSLQGG
jgi:hypothetical protein